MKKLILLLPIMFGCFKEASEPAPPFSYECKRPDEIPDTLVGGAPVYWDCDWHASYVNGRVSLERDSLSRIVAIKRFLK